MSTISLIIEERATPMGNLLVGRLLPFRQKRAVGPFVFIDHMGPMSFTERQQLEVGAHPHIGLSTLTYLLDGAIMHHDSLGSNQLIEPGAVNWMTAGSGIVHTERTSAEDNAAYESLHGLQLWVALPKEKEDMDPQFFHADANALPVWNENNVSVRLIAGSMNDFEAPVPVHSPLYFAEFTTSSADQLDFNAFCYGEAALYVMSGEIEIDGCSFGPKQLIVSENADFGTVLFSENAQVFLFGGTPFEEERFIDWNFVSHDKEKLKAAKLRWMNHEFPKIEGETSYIPYPTLNK